MRAGAVIRSNMVMENLKSVRLFPLFAFQVFFSGIAILPFQVPLFDCHP